LAALFQIIFDGDVWKYFYAEANLNNAAPGDTSGNQPISWGLLGGLYEYIFLAQSLFSFQKKINLFFQKKQLFIR